MRQTVFQGKQCFIGTNTGTTSISAFQTLFGIQTVSATIFPPYIEKRVTGPGRGDRRHAGRAGLGLRGRADAAPDVRMGFIARF